MTLFDGPLWWLPLGHAPEITAEELAASLGHVDGQPADEPPPSFNLILVIIAVGLLARELPERHDEAREF